MHPSCRKKSHWRLVLRYGRRFGNGDIIFAQLRRWPRRRGVRSRIDMGRDPGIRGLLGLAAPPPFEQRENDHHHSQTQNRFGDIFGQVTSIHPFASVLNASVWLNIYSGVYSAEFADPPEPYIANNDPNSGHVVIVGNQSRLRTSPPKPTNVSDLLIRWYWD